VGSIRACGWAARGAGVAAFACERPESLAALLILAVVAAAVARPDPKSAARVAVGLAMIAWATTLSQALFYSMSPRTPWLALGPLVVWREGLAYGLVQSIRFAALTVGGLVLVATTPPDRLLTALVRLRCRSAWRSWRPRRCGSRRWSPARSSR